MAGAPPAASTSRSASSQASATCSSSRPSRTWRSRRREGGPSSGAYPTRAGGLTLAAAPSLLEGARPPAALSGVVDRMVTVRRPGGAGRLLLLTALLGTAAYFWWARAVPPELPAPVPVPAAALALAPASPPSPLLALPPEQMRDALHAAYRLQPDRRCLTAFAEVQAWLGGRDPLPVSATFAQDAWRIEIAGEGVGTLPELPDFDDCMKALEKWAAVVGKGKGAAHGGRGAPAPGPPRLNPVDLLADLRAADSHGADPRELPRVSRDLVYLTLQSLDLLDVTDRLRAKAWAFLAMSAALGDADLRRETALLAYLLDYSESARRLAAALPGADPVRAFVLHDDRGLTALAEASRDELGALLVLLRRAEEHDYPGWLAWVQAHYVERPFAFPVLKSALELNAFLPNRVFSEVMLYLVLTYLFRETADTSWTRQVRELDLYAGSDDAVGVIAALIGRALRVQAGDLVLRFEGELDLAGEHYRGPVLDADTYAAFYAGYFYSALWASAQFRLDQLASVSAAAPFGAQPRFRTFEALDPYLVGGPGRFEAVRRMVSAMDSRPLHAAWLARTAERQLDDLNLAERLYRHLLRVAERRLPDDAVWSAYLFGDTPRLARYVDDPTLLLDSRRRAIGYLASLRPARDPSIERLYRRLLRDFPDSWRLTGDLVTHLEWKGEYATARAVASAWLARGVPQAGLEGVSARTAIARTYCEEGRYAEAWEAIKPALASWDAGALARAALIRDRLADPQHAEALFLLDMDRYPDLLWVRTHYVQLLWEHGRYKDAADALRAWKGPLGPQAWLDDIRARFYEAFKKMPDEEVLQAFEALERSGLPAPGLSHLWYPFELEGRHELAFRMSSGLTTAPSIAGVEFLTASYQMLKQLGGAATARAVRCSRITSGRPGPARPRCSATSCSGRRRSRTSGSAPSMPARAPRARTRWGCDASARGATARPRTGSGSRRSSRTRTWASTAGRRVSSASGASGSRPSTASHPAAGRRRAARRRRARSVTRDCRARERGHRLRFDSAPLDAGPGATDPSGAS